MGDAARASGWRRGLPAAALVAALGVAATAVGIGVAVHAARRDADIETATRLGVVGDAMDRQVSRYAETLYGLRAAFALDPDLDRQHFHDLLDLEALTRRNPGAQAISFNRAVTAAELDAFEERVRQTLPQFRVHPQAAAREHLVVDYLEPLQGNEEALGFDTSSDPVRRAALDFARDTGELAATAPVRLVQESRRAGFLLVLAAYDVAPQPVTAPSRRRHLLGAVVAAFDAEQMLSQALETTPGVTVSIYDAGATVDTPRARARPQDWLVGGPDGGSQSTDINVGTRRWRLVARRPVPVGLATPLAVGVTGLALTLLVAGTIASLAGARRRAVSLASSMTADLRDSRESLRMANDELREADRLKDVFLATVSHELRTPLTAIAGVSDLLNRRNDRLEQGVREQLIALLADNVRNLRGLIDELLDFTRLQGDDNEPALEVVDVEALVRQVTSELEPVLETHDVHVESAPAQLPALANPLALSRVLNNLLVNAAKYSPPGGPIRVSVREEGDTVLVSVTDAGPGIPPDERERVFERFYRGASDAVIRQPGTGIGLAVVKELCARMQATVTIADASGGGSDFQVRLLPVEQQPAGRHTSDT